MREKIKSRREKRKLSAAVRRYLKESRRVLKRSRHKTTPDKLETLREARRRLKEAMKKRERQGMELGLRKVKDVLETDFSFARKSTFREWSESIGVALILVFIIRTFVVQPFKIPTGSMEPTLLGIKKECPVCHRPFRFDEKFCPDDHVRLKTMRTGDRILVNKFIYGAKTPDRIPFTATLLPYLRLPALRSPRRGDIVVFHYPENLKQDFVKRLVGLPGETLEIKRGQIWIDGEPATEPELKDVSYYNSNLEPFGRRGQQFKVPEAGATISLNRQNIDRWSQLIRNEGHTLELKKGKIIIDGKPRREYAVKENQYFVLGDNSANSRDSRFWGFVPERDLVGKVFFIYWPPRRWGLAD